MIHAESYNPDRTHSEVTHLVQYGEQGKIERGIEMLMRHAQGSITNVSVRVQAVGLLVDLNAVLLACGEDPALVMQSALASAGKQVKAVRARLEAADEGAKQE